MGNVILETAYRTELYLSNSHISAVTAENVNENAAVQMQPLIFIHQTAFGENFD
jgi:glutamyl-tRNA reductase